MEYTIPEDLSTLDDEALAELIAQLDKLFDEGIESGSTDLAGMTQLTEDIEKLAGEKVAREEKAEADAQALRDLQQRRAQAVGTSDDEETTTETAETEGASAETEGAEVPEPELVTAGGTPGGTRRIQPGARATAANAPVEEPTTPARPAIVITAAADLPNWAAGAEMGSLVDVAKAMKARSRALQIGGNGAVVASFHLPIPEGDFLDEAASANVAILDRVASEANSIVAAGGYCGPYDVIREFFTLDHSGGLLDLPNVGVRGGVQVPDFIGLADASEIGWTWTVADDVAAQTTFQVVEKALTANVATLTTSQDHSIQVGDIVRVAGVDATFDGTHTVTGVGADTISYAVTAANVAATAATGQVTNTTSEVRKPCFRIPCPTWTTYETAADGLCIIHGNLLNMQMPALEAKWVGLALDAHMHRISASNIAAMLTDTHSVAVTVAPVTPTDTAGEILSAIGLQTADYRSQHKINRNVTLEAVFPEWTLEVIRANMAMRAGVDLLNVTDTQITAWFASRGIRAQFVSDYLPLWTGSGDAAATAWPTSLQFILYPAGGFVNGDGGTIDLGVIRDSTLNETNDFTAAWTEEFHVLIRRGPLARRVNVSLDTSGATGCCPAA